MSLSRKADHWNNSCAGWEQACVANAKRERGSTALDFGGSIRPILVLKQGYQKIHEHSDLRKSVFTLREIDSHARASAVVRVPKYRDKSSRCKVGTDKECRHVSNAESAQNRRMHCFGVIRPKAAGNPHPLDGSSPTQNPLVLDRVRASEYQTVVI